jgi:hypothetical protein
MFTPPLAELDPVQIIIVVIAMMGGFFQWLWNLIQQSRSEAERRRAGPPTVEENALREDAWKRQPLGEPMQPRQTPARPSPTATPPPMNDPFSMVRELFEQVKREAMQSQNPPQPVAPPPIRQRKSATAPRRGSVGTEASAPPYQPSSRRSGGRAEANPSATAAAAAAAPPTARPAAPEPTPAPTVSLTTPAPAWAALLNSTAGLQQAFVLSEILGPPKALQTAADSAA